MSKFRFYKEVSSSLSSEELENYIDYIKEQATMINENTSFQHNFFNYKRNSDRNEYKHNINVLSVYKSRNINPMSSYDKSFYIDKYVYNVGDAINKTKYLFGKSILELLKVKPTTTLLNKMYKLFSGYYFDSIMFYGLDDLIPKGFKFSYNDVKYFIETYKLGVVISEEEYNSFAKRLYNYFKITLNKDNPPIYFKVKDDKFSIDSSKTYIKLFDISPYQIDKLKSRYKGENFYNDVANLLFIYSSISSVNNHLSIPPVLLSKLKINVELFGTPFNTTLNKFCSPFYTLEKNFGSQGNFFDFRISSNTNYTYNPPYVDELMFEAGKLLKQQLEKIENYYIVGVLPAWEKDFRGFDILRTIPTFKDFVKLDAKEYTYYDYYSNSLIPASDTFLFIITDRKEYDKLDEITKEWKNSLEIYHKNS
jgi:hypothetical protein